MRTLLLTIATTLLMSTHAQTILNGSFENDSPSCSNNASNTQFNNVFTDVKAIGSLNSIGIMKNSSCGNSVSANEGSYFLQMASNYSANKEAAISLALSAPLTVGVKYYLTYYDNSVPSQLQCALEFVISMNDSTFGTLKYTSPYFPAGWWTKRTVQFTANIAASYITVRTNTQGSGFACVDNFKLTSNLTGIEEAQPGIQLSVYPNPLTTNAVIQMEGADHISSATLRVYDLVGNLVREHVEPLTNGQINFSRADLSTGLYIVKLYNKDLLLSAAKLMVE